MAVAKTKPSKPEPKQAPAAKNDNAPAEFSKQQELAAYREMLLIRRFE